MPGSSTEEAVKDPKALEPTKVGCAEACLRHQYWERAVRLGDAKTGMVEEEVKQKWYSEEEGGVLRNGGGLPPLFAIASFVARCFRC